MEGTHMKWQSKTIMVAAATAAMALGTQGAASADVIPNINITYELPGTDTVNTGVLLATTPVGTNPDSVQGECAGTPTGGNFGQVTYQLYAQAHASSTSGDVPLATGITCRIWNAAGVGGWLTAPVSGSEPGPEAVATGSVTIGSNTNPVACVYTNGLFTGNHTSADHSLAPCPKTSS